MGSEHAPAQSSWRTLSDWVETVQQQLEDAAVCYGHGTDNSRDEAVWLVSHALDIDPATVDCHAAMAVDQAAVARLESLVRARVQQRLPAAYLTGRTWFAGLAFEVDRHTLIPRSPIAELILDGLPLWPLQAGDRVLDLCTGNGCIGIALAVHQPALHVDATDLSGEALAVAARNAARHGCTGRVELIQGDLFAPVQDRQYALIISNPPYVSRQEWRELPAEFHHEPVAALVSGEDGLDLPLRILEGAAARLQPGGSLILEVGHSADALDQLLPDMTWTWLEFAAGGSGVLSVTRDDLVQHGDRLRSLLAERDLRETQPCP